MSKHVNNVFSRTWFLLEKKGYSKLDAYNIAKKIHIEKGNINKDLSLTEEGLEYSKLYSEERKEIRKKRYKNKKIFY